MTISPEPPHAALTLPWDDPTTTDSVGSLAAARAALGDTFDVVSGHDRYLFVFSPAALRAFYALPERDASKGIADYRMLVRKLPAELSPGVTVATMLALTNISSAPGLDRTVRRLVAGYELDARFTTLRPIPDQIGGVARAADPCPIAYRARARPSSSA